MTEPASPDTAAHESRLSKKVKLDHGSFDPKDMVRDLLLRFFLSSSTSQTTTTTPPHKNGDVQSRLERIRKDWEAAGFRATLVLSPQPGVSVYKPTLLDEEVNKYDTFYTTLLGIHPQQDVLEDMYQQNFRQGYCFILHCQHLQQLLLPSMNQAADRDTLRQLLEETSTKLETSLKTKTTDEPLASFPIVQTELNHIHQVARNTCSHLSLEQLEHEWERLVRGQHATLSNALLQAWMRVQDVTLSDVIFKPCPQAPQYERFTLYIPQEVISSKRNKQESFSLLPCTPTLVQKGRTEVVKNMLLSVSQYLLRQGYFISSQVQRDLEPQLRQYFLSGLSNRPDGPVSLAARFSPTNYPLSLFLVGPAGCGKSSLLRYLGPSLQSTLMEYVDPQLTVSQVKQNLNKPLQTLQLELELRPNNNDLSIMSLVQGRRQPLHQTKPGLVLLGLEEMAPCSSQSSSHVRAPPRDPEQVEVCQLLSQRFAGRKGNNTARAACSTVHEKKGGLSGDATIMTVFTSNYHLSPMSWKELQKLEMFQKLTIISCNFIIGEERKRFAKDYLGQCLEERLGKQTNLDDIQLDISFGDGDIRRLVKQLRMMAFHVCALVVEKGLPSSKISIVQKDLQCDITIGPHSQVLRMDTMSNLYPLRPKSERQPQFPAPAFNNPLESFDLEMIIEYWLGNVLAPAVVVSTNFGKLKSITQTIAKMNRVHSILNVSVDEYKMIKSLYDYGDVPNLRNDILTAKKTHDYVAVELVCKTFDAQLKVREILEDTPSQTAFSSDRTSLKKDCLLFAVYVKGEITPEMKSRASYIIL